MKLAPHRATTKNLAGAYPLLASPALPPSVFVGTNRESGSAFCWDPWELYRKGVLRSPNMLVIGEIGLGKSALVKTMVGRHSLFGHRKAFVVSPKPGEYDALCASLGAAPIRLEPGGGVRVNPLTGQGTLPVEQLSRLVAIAESVLGRPLTPREKKATRDVLEAARSTRELTIPALVAATGWDDGGDVRLALEDLCSGELAGMFDGPTTESAIDLDAKIVVLDLGAVWNSTALNVAMVAAAGWMRAIVTARDQTQRFLIVDEAWRVMGSTAGAELLQSSTKTSRSYGVANVLVLHKLADLATAGDQGSRISTIVQNLLADCETRVIFRQPSDQLDATADLLQLTDTEVGWVRSLERGEALWKVGAKYSAVVRHRLSDMEKAIVDTDARMRGDQP